MRESARERGKDVQGMNPHRTVTVIIIFLNGERYIAEAIDSVLAQTFGDWELLLCDDGTTDGATAIARDYAARYPDKIRYLEHPNHANRGMSATRNLGIRAARGEFVAMLDADDAWMPNKLERQVAILRQHPDVAMCYGPLTLWYSWTGWSKDRGRDFLQTLGVPADQVLPIPGPFIAFQRDVMHHPSGTMVRRAALEEVGLYDDRPSRSAAPTARCGTWCPRGRSATGPRSTPPDS